MSWKATIEINREKAIELIEHHLYCDNLTNNELSNVLEAIGFGDKTELPYFGYNFSIIDEDTEETKQFQSFLE